MTQATQENANFDLPIGKVSPKAKIYFDLTNDNLNIDDLLITQIFPETSGKNNCKITDQQNNSYDGFILATTKNTLTICEIDFFTDFTKENSIPGKCKIRLEFRKTDLDYNTQTKKSRKVIISLDETTKGRLTFWKVIKFLLKHKDILDIEGFEDYSKLTDQNLIDALNNLSNINNKEQTLNILTKLSPEDIENIHYLAGISSVKNILENWQEDNSTEKYWQELFENNKWILSQIFANSLTFCDKNWKTGAATDDNKDGPKGDFRYINKFTNSIAIIEIKTPQTGLVKTNPYRGENDGDPNTVYSISEEITGAINQTLNQKNSWIESKKPLGSLKLSANCKCVVIAGTIKDLETGQKKSFELFRESLRNIEIITYDELKERIESVLKIFEKTY